MTPRTYTDPSVLAGIAAGASWADPTWHGWEIAAHAVEPSADLAPLDTDTTDALTALAAA